MKRLPKVPINLKLDFKRYDLDKDGLLCPKELKLYFEK